MDTNFEKLQFTLRPNIGGILWVTEKSLNEKPTVFHELDYFFNHMISKYLLIHNDSDQSFFSTRQFDQSLFLGHFKSDSINLQNNIQQVLKMGLSNLQERSILLIGSQVLQSSFKKIISKNPQIKFEKFVL